ncbi:MAG: phenol hydroxylase [Proteobacteria bacterium]|nr:phenol hydroxylase [Pseudomonadota bacterium]
MHIDIRTADSQPLRHTFANLQRRFGNKEASRYQEATYDLQEAENFHYRPLWQADKELYDASRTAIVMADWYVLKDPRQLYYQTYTNTRARQQEVVDGHFDFVDKKGLMATLPADVRELALRALLPLRHYEWGANMNNGAITAWGHGSALTNATTFAMTDRLGLAQSLSRIGLLADGNSGSSLNDAKARWLDDPAWQPLRAALEHLFVERDWFRLFVAQNLVFDGLLYPLVYQRFEQRLAALGGGAIAMLLTMQSEWYAETVPWVDAVCRAAADESAANRALIVQWVGDARRAAREALAPLADAMFGAGADTQIDAVESEFDARLRRIDVISPSGDQS